MLFRSSLPRRTCREKEVDRKTANRSVLNVHRGRERVTFLFVLSYILFACWGCGTIWAEPGSGSAPEDQSSSEEQAFLNELPSSVKVPDGFSATLYASPPDVNYPACIAAAGPGQLFVGVDPQGSLGKKSGNGKVLQCIDQDGDGKADEISTFAEVDHPRGLVYKQGTLWVLHPPKLTAFHDRNQDGTPEDKDVLIRGLSTKEIEGRGADHTVNGIRMGTDGWIYIAVGDFGLKKTTDADGNTISRAGGGVLRVRPDGTDLNVYCWGTRNIYDIAIDPYMNLFSRGNTNDGIGWWVRLNHFMETAYYGYPSLYRTHPEELMPPLGEYGAGSGSGALYVHDLRWPDSFEHLLLTADWGTSHVYLHRLTPAGPSFTASQESFIELSKPTDLDLDRGGSLYVSSWKNGRFTYSGPNVGYILQVQPESYDTESTERSKQLSFPELVERLAAPSQKVRLNAQRALLRREIGQPVRTKLVELAENEKQPRYARATAVFTLGQIPGEPVNKALFSFLSDSEIAPFAVRALVERNQVDDKKRSRKIKDLIQHPDPRVRAQAIIGIGKIGSVQHAEILLPVLNWSPEDSPRSRSPSAHSRPDTGRVIPHLALRALISLNAWKPCIKALNGPHEPAALLALRYMYRKDVVDAIIRTYRRTSSLDRHRRMLTTLARLYYRRKSNFDGSWWGTRPKPEKTFARSQTWAESSRIASFLRKIRSSADQAIADHLREQVRRTGIPLQK